MATKPATDQPTRRETWAYTGRRLSRDGALRHVWQDQAGARHVFGRQLANLHPGVGACYELAVNDETVWTGHDHNPLRVERPAWVTDDMVVHWDTEDQATMAQRQRATAERKLNEALPDLHTALAPIKAVYHSQRNRHAKAAVLAAVLAELERW